MGLIYNPLLLTGLQFSSSGGGGSPTIGGPVIGGTSGSVLFVGPGSILSQDNANFSFNDTTHSLTITGNLSAATFNGYTPENVANKGVANGYAPLDGSAKVPYANLPSALMTFKGAWNPTTNTPTLTNGTGLAGDTYRASVGGTSTSPIADTWFAGDFIIYNGTIWQRSPLADGVISVNGMSGAVVLTQGNLTDSTAGADGITITGGTNAVWGSGTSIAQTAASASNPGYLTAANFTIFNNKQPAFTAQTANTVYAGPSSGSAAIPTFRSLVAADIPSLTAVYANVNLSNLASPTSVNQSLIPSTDNTFNIGSNTNTTYGSNIFSTGNGDESINSTNNTTRLLAQSFTSQATGTNITVSMALCYTPSPLSGNATVTIQTDNGSGHPSGTILGTQTFNAATLPIISGNIVQALTTVNFPSVTLTNGVKYHIVLDTTAVTYPGGAQIVWIETDPSPSGVGATGNEFSNNNGTNWSFFDTSTENFYFNVTTASIVRWAIGYFGTSVQTPSLQLEGSTSGALTMNASATTTSYSITWPAAQASGTQILQNNGSGVLSWVTPSSGSVSSVALADSTGLFNITGSPVTSTGTLTLSSFQSQSANTFFAAPNGSPGAPTFRTIVAADIPTLNQNTTGTASNITAVSNSTLTTLTGLSLPGSQVTGNISGNAANITATTNSTLTTLSSLSLPYSQVTGTPAALIFVDSLVNTSGTVTLVGDVTSPAASQYYGTNGSSVRGYYNLPASNPGTVTSVSVVSANGFTGIVATPTSTPAITLTGTLSGDVTGTLTATTLTVTTNSTLTTLSALSLPGSQVTGNISGNAANVTGIVAEVNGGTNQNSYTTGDTLYASGSNTLSKLPIGTAGQVLTVSAGIPTWQPAPGTVSAFFASSQVTTTSTLITATTFTTFDNSPAFTFTPTITGTYKIYSSLPLEAATSNDIVLARIFNTSGGANLLNESQTGIYESNPIIISSVFTESIYTLTAGTSYQFDIQGKANSSGAQVYCRGDVVPFYMFAELEVAGTASQPTGSYYSGYMPNGTSWTTSSSTQADFSNSGSNTLTSRGTPTIIVTAAASNLPGITFTPASSSAVYEIGCVIFAATLTALNSNTIYLTDGTIMIQEASAAQGTFAPLTMNGIYAPGTSSPVTVKLQGSVNGGDTLELSAGQSAPSIEWTIVRIA